MSDLSPISNIPLNDPLKIKLGSEFSDYLLVLSVQPLNLYFKNHKKLSRFDDLESRYLEDYELGILLEDKRGSRIMGLINYKSFRNLKSIPEVGMRYKFSGNVERFLKKIDLFDMVYLGCRIEKVGE